MSSSSTTTARRHPAGQPWDDTFAFVNAPPPHKVLAITGGSGQFRTAHGEGTLDENPDETGTLVLRLSA